MATRTMDMHQATTAHGRWTVERMLRLAAGTFVLVSAGLALAVHPNWLYVTLLVGANLFQSAFTNWCPLMALLRRAGMK